MTSKNFKDTNGYLYRQDDIDVNTYHLHGWTTDSGATDSILLSGVYTLICDFDLPNQSVFPPTAFTALSTIKVSGWKSLATFLPNATVLATLDKLEINGTQVNIITQNFATVTDLLLINNENLTTITSTAWALLKRLVIINCPFQKLPVAVNNAKVVHLEGTNITSLLSTIAPEYLYISPRFFNATFSSELQVTLPVLLTRRDVKATAHVNTSVIRID
jgi:hypothetical protein